MELRDFLLERAFVEVLKCVFVGAQSKRFDAGKKGCIEFFVAVNDKCFLYLYILEYIWQV